MIKRIKVYLIDDNPTFALTKVVHTTLTNIKEHQKEVTIPFITVSESYFEPYLNLFELKWLRNQEDLQQFKKLSRAIEDQYSALELGNIGGAVPEIVLFDYALTGHEEKGFLDEKFDLDLLEQINPNYNLMNYLKEKRINENDNLPNSEHIEIKATQIADGLNSDNLGCIGGIMTVTQFRNHPCIGIAISRKTDEHIKGQDVQFMESLVKEPNQFDFSLRGNYAKNLKWEVLLKKSVYLLRQRIETLVESKKIVVNLNKLMEFTQEKPKDFNKRFLIYESIYGVRHLPLDGLFIDEDDSTRDAAITKWIKGENENDHCLLNIIATTSNIKNTIMNKAISRYTSIYDTYKEKFLDRILLSDFSKRNEESNICQYESIFNDLKSKFEVSEKNEINSTQLSNIQILFDSNDNEYTESEAIPINRLTVLMLVTKFWIDFCSGNELNNGLPLTKQDYYYVLNPIENNHKDKNKLLLLMHMNDEKDNKGKSNKSRYMEKFAASFERSTNIPKSTWYNFAEWINTGEKIILKSYFFSELSSLKKYPDWLM